ncbi:HTTM domain-containing protein [Seonamhaeicola sp. ML3]|uniref:HTTM domain-containing protein n=1 Tax=Seonamhaeicola sp. ML3 TaxID=2937786 RepID=UPI00200BDD09|nr:HTTM domain-containing protein [Seonamhaeicola sp. ML3]
MINTWLFKHIDNSGLIVFRIFFGLLCFLESVGAIFTGWIKATLIDPKFTFSFIGFEWLQPLPGNGMYFYYAIMGLFGLLVMIGYKYRFSMFAFAVLWSGTYLMQKSSYNNHYYLLMLLSTIMIFLPANRYASLDAKQNPDLKRYSMPLWCKQIFVLQLLIVYTYASVAKLYPDWLDTSVIALMMKSKSHFVLVGDILQEKWLHYALAYGGILFDGLIIPLLLFKPTRKYALIVSIFFHLFNSFIFHIGIFPYLSLAFSLFFFEPKTIQRLFLKKKPFYDAEDIKVPKYKPLLLGVFGLYFIVQILLPLRHHIIEDNVLWTEEGHRLSWRMMLRTRYGKATFKIKDKETGVSKVIDLNNYLTKKQKHQVSSKPDFMWQFSKYLKNKFQEEGQDISVFITCKVSINGKPAQQFINPNVDIASLDWEPFKHGRWILPSKLD